MKPQRIERKVFGIKRKGVKRLKFAKITQKAIKPRVKRKKVSKAAFYRSWGIFPGTWIRYSGIKGVYWYYFSKTIRNRDYKEHGGLCMTCLKPVERGQDQAGHLFAAKNCGFALLFHPLNVHLQHSKCNNPRFTPSAGIYNTLHIAHRYGNKAIAQLLNLKETKTKEWSKTEYETKIKELEAYAPRT